MHRLLSAALAGLVLFATTAAPTAAQDGGPFKGKTITIVVGYSAGGGNDLYARTFARHVGRSIPGQPNAIVQNMPGAATLLSVRHLESNPAKDGTVITLFDPGLITAALASDGTSDQPKLVLADFGWVGSMVRDVGFCYAWAATGIKTWADVMKRKEFLIGATARGSNAYLNGAILRTVLGGPVKQVLGYPGSNEQRLALERGELEGACASWSALPPNWIAERKVNALLRYSTVRPNDMPEDVPYAGDLLTDPEQKQLLKLLNSPAELGRPLIVAKQVPAANLAVLRAAFDATMKDKEFGEDLKRQSLPLDPVSGAEAETLLKTFYSASPEMIKKMVKVLE